MAFIFIYTPSAPVFTLSTAAETFKMLGFLPTLDTSLGLLPVVVLHFIWLHPSCDNAQPRVRGSDVRVRACPCAFASP